MNHRTAAAELNVILEELDTLSARAKDILRQHFPETAEVADHYKALQFGRSWNPYDTTFASLLRDVLPEELDEIEFYEGFLEEQDQLIAEFKANRAATAD